MSADAGSQYKPILERDKRPLRAGYVVLNFKADVYQSALIKLQPLLDTLRKNHDDLRAHNDRTVKLGVAMEKTLKPVEDGMRIEKERKAAEDAAKRIEYENGRGEEGKGDEAIRSVGRSSS